MLDTRQIAVIDIKTERVITVTRFETDAANALEPGTVFGKGETREIAIEMARRWASWFRTRKIL